MSGPATTPYRIETERLLLRAFDPADAPELSRVVSESLETLRPWMPWIVQEPMTLDERVGLLRRFRSELDRDENWTYALVERAEGALIGGVGLHPRVGPGAIEIGYWLHPERAGAGRATEAAAALTRVAFELHRVDRVEIRCDPRNERSAAVARRLGYEREAVLRRRFPVGDELRDSELWVLFAADYPASPAASSGARAWDALDRPLLV